MDGWTDGMGWHRLGGIMNIVIDGGDQSGGSWNDN